MIQNNFSQRKKDILSKLDKSSKQSWDSKIIDLCSKINNSEKYYTTSSCAGRIVLMIDQDKKEQGLFLYVSHNKINFEELKTELDKIENKEMIKFKTEPPIIHIACKDLDSASELLEKAKHIGFKRSGINTISKNIILELNSTEKLEFPIMKNGNILVDNEFLKIITEKSDVLLKKGWGKIKKLEEFYF
jgi:tRNA wybutosine-synthesizing protein 3